MGSDIDSLEMKLRFNQAFELCGAGVCDYHLPPTPSVYFCDHWAKILGYRVSEVPGVPIFFSWWGQQIHPNDHARVIKTFNRLYSGEDSRLISVFRIRHKQGHWLNVEVTATALSRDSKGWARHVFTVMRDLNHADNRYQTIIENLHEGLWLLDKHNATQYVNQRMADLLGYEPDEMQGKSMQSFMDAAGMQICDAILKRHYEGEQENYFFELIHKDGHKVYVAMSSSPIFNHNSQYDGLVIAVIDVSEQREQNLRLKMLSGAVEQSGSMVMITNQDAVIEYVNPKFSLSTGYAITEVVGKKADMLQPVDMDKEQLKEMKATIQLGEDWHGEIQTQKKNGQLFWAQITISALRDESGSISHYITVGEDISERKETQQKMEQLAYVDSLTGLANRVLFRDRLEQVLKSLQRSHKQAALLFLDLDHFKRINDSLGHDVGDALLMKVAESLRQCVRHQDTVARMGGDEFVILLTDVDGMAGASAVARKIIEIMEQPNRLLRHEIIISPSIGITMAPDDSLNADVLLKNADLAMYKAKSSGRNNYQFFTDEMNAQVLDNLMMENELRQAIDRDELLLNFQPQMSINSGQLAGVEALVRWNHPEKGLMDPDDFIPVAEQAGLIIPLGEWILRNACRQWRAAEVSGMPNTKLSVNLSARQFKDPHLLDTIQNILEETGFKPIQLELEITETTLMESLEHAIDVLDQIKALGISVSIDDFGTGYSSLNYLKRLPIDALKVDRTFIRDIPENKDDMAITAAVIAMAHKLKLDVIAEGVETSEQWDFLKQNRCDFAQGYLLGKPSSAKDLLLRFCQS